MSQVRRTHTRADASTGEPAGAGLPPTAVPAAAAASSAAAEPAASPGALAHAIREEARRLGFTAAGFARAEKHPHAERLLEWIREGRHGTMRWMARDAARRADPREVLRGARTVISLALPYYRGDWPSPYPGAEPQGRIARYAWGRDYHKRIRSRMHRLARWIGRRLPAMTWLAYADTGAVLDRGWAERGGVGWIGKNTNLIRKESGSWHFLGEILTNLEFPSNAPGRNYCGSCVRCIAACPTGAIVGPYQLDAGRCISYLTIEHKGAIPIGMRPLIGARIFGCDDCQEVCPWNRFAVRTLDPDFLERPGQRAPELIPLLALDEEGFHRTFAGAAIRRAGRARFVRNVAVALGNAADPRAVPALIRSLNGDSEPTVRSHAAWALGRIGGDPARTALEAASRSESDVEVRLEIAAALGENLPREPRNTVATEPERKE